MALDEKRSIDVADIASVDLMTLNNKIVSIRNTVKKAKAHVIRKVIRTAKSLTSKKGSDDKLEKNKRKSERLLEEIQVIKHLKPDKISKFALGNTMSFAELCKTGKASVESRALTRVSENQLIQKFVEQFRNQHADWKALAAYLLMKQSGRRYKKKKNKATSAKIDTNIKARETMMQTYLEKKLEADPGTMSKPDSVQEREKKKGKQKKKLNFKDENSDFVSKENDSESEFGQEFLKDSENRVGGDKPVTKVGDSGKRTPSKINVIQIVCHESDDSGSPTPTRREEKRIVCLEGDDSDNRVSTVTRVDVSKHKNQVATEISKSAEQRQNTGSLSEKAESVEKRLSKNNSEELCVQKKSLKLQVLQQMFPSKGSDSESEDEVAEKQAEASGGDSDSTEDDSSSPDKGMTASMDPTDRKSKKSKGCGTMVVKKISLKELGNEDDLVVQKDGPDEVVPAILTSPSEVRKTRDTFFACSDEGEDSSEDSGQGDDDDDDDENLDSDQDDEVEDGKRGFESTFIGTLAHKRRLKKGNFNREGDDRNFRGGGFRGKGARGGRSHFSSGSSHGDFRGRGRGFRGRSDERGRGGYRTFGNNDPGGKRSSWGGADKRQDGMSKNFNPKRKEEYAKKSPKKSEEFAQRGVSKSEELHPSWEASKRKKGQLGIQQFQGKKIKFDD